MATMEMAILKVSLIGIWRNENVFKENKVS